jgi:hypothetical protein
MYVKTKINSFSTSLFEKNVLVPDVETYGRSAAFTLGKASQTSGYWIHGLQVRRALLIISLLFHSKVFFADCRDETGTSGL